ncbi:MAG: ABC transporter ATP-binding protein [Pirellulales bacterium]
MSDIILSDLPKTQLPGARSPGARKNAVAGPHVRFPAATETAPTPHAQPTASHLGEVQLAAHGVVKSYRKGKLEIPVLRGVDLELRKGEFLAIIGQSGSGKSTLLHLLGTLNAPDAGEVTFWNRRIDNVAVRAQDRLRNEEFGMIFQFYHLLPELSALENVLMPMMIRQSWLGYRLKKKQYEARAKELLDLVGLGHRIRHKPREMSGGEMQRTAIARALVADPQVLLADEPTGNLDADTGGEILELLRKLNRERGLSMIMVTHDQSLAAKSDRTVMLAHGKVVQK